MLYFPVADKHKQVPKQAVSIIMTDDMQDDVKPSMLCQMGEAEQRSKQNSKLKAIGGKSASTTFSACLEEKADLAALMIRHKWLKDKHEWEEEEQLRRRTEKLQLHEEIAAYMSELHVLWSQTIISGVNSITKLSDGTLIWKKGN